MDFLTDATDREVVADWNDVDAAVSVGASRAEMAVVSRSEGPGWDGEGGDPSMRVFELKTVRDEPAWLLVTRGAAGGTDSIQPMAIVRMERNGAAAPVPLTLRAKVGRYGDPAREQALLRGVADRLQALKGRDWRRLD